MKSETVMLGSLFAACLLVCTLVLGSMFTMRPAATRTLANADRACATAVAGTACPLARG
ncbi:MAG: hypothetical protein RSP_02090 [Rhodanobacter sp.]